MKKLHIVFDELDQIKEYTIRRGREFELIPDPRKILSNPTTEILELYSKVRGPLDSYMTKLLSDVLDEAEKEAKENGTYQPKKFMPNIGWHIER